MEQVLEQAVETSADRTTADRVPSRQRSRVTNGSRMFVEGDGRSPWARRWRDLVAAHASDLGGAGVLSEAQRSLIRRCATIELQLEQIEGRLSEGKSADLGTYAAASGHLRRILATLGLKRVPRDVMTLSQYLASLPKTDGDHA